MRHAANPEGAERGGETITGDRRKTWVRSMVNRDPYGPDEYLSAGRVDGSLRQAAT